MKIEQRKWKPSHGWQLAGAAVETEKVALVLVFGDRFLLEDEGWLEELKKIYSHAEIVISSTSGSILGVNLEDQALVSTAIVFEKSSTIKIKKINAKDTESSFKAGQTLAGHLDVEGLVHVLVLSDGHIVNGSELVKGMLSALPKNIALTGGLAGDGTRFEKTLVGANGPPREGEIVAIGFYGQHLKFGFGSVGGWDPFGIERRITRSKQNILYELDGKIALDIYKKYLGDEAEKLPGSALLFPLSIRADKHSPPLVRTILNINEADKSMIFAGDVPEGWLAQLMKANFDRLIDGAFQAANASYVMIGKQPPELALLISCVGRRMVLDQRTEEEIESVRDLLGKEACIAGFYSYGEIAPTAPQASCELHNQTMTITTISER